MASDWWKNSPFTLFPVHLRVHIPPPRAVDNRWSVYVLLWCSEPEEGREYGGSYHLSPHLNPGDIAERSLKWRMCAKVKRPCMGISSFSHWAISPPSTDIVEVFLSHCCSLGSLWAAAGSLPHFQHTRPSEYPPQAHTVKLASISHMPMIARQALMVVVLCWRNLRVAPSRAPILQRHLNRELKFAKEQRKD